MTQYTARLTGAVPFNLQETFECGQCFRWLPGDDGSYTGVVGQNVITLRTDGDDLLVAGLDQAEAEQRLIPYLALDEDYAAIQEQFRRNAQLAQAVDYARGIRVLRQERWEALCSFIISQNNNIPRIAAITGRLCEGLGEKLGEGLYSFPAPEALAAREPEDLAFLRAGWRAEYLIDAARKVASGQVSEAALAALSDTAFRRATLDAVRQGRATLRDGLTKLGCAVWPSAANFLLFQLPPGAGTARDCFEALLRRGIIIRPLNSYHLPEHLRVSVGDAKENATFLAAMRDILTGSEGRRA